MVDVVVGILSDKLLKVLESEWHRQLALGELFNKMNDELLFMRSFLQDVERVRRKDQTETLKIAKKNLMELVYDAEDAIADCQVQFAEQHKGSLSKYMQSWSPKFINWSPKLINFRREMTKRLMVINQGIEEVKKSMISYLSTAPTPTSREEGNTRPLSYPILINDDKIVGLEDGLDTIERWVLQTDELFTMIGIVGMGGIGKSTLAQKICSRLKHSFEYIAFVPVSQCLKFEDVLLEMLREKIASKSSHSGGEVHELLDMLKRELEDKKYLLVLDDVWETAEGMWWDNLNSILPKRNGGCVIVTTRKLKVAGSMGVDRNHIHQVKTLSHDDSWSLFTKIAFARTGGKCCNPDLEHFGKEIIARCEGLPLAITAVGGMMLAKGDSVQEWRRTSMHQKDEIGMLVMSRLELSYDELPSHLKPCFLCFAMYPENIHIYIDEIIGRWIAEGFVSARNGRTAFETGEEYIAELMDRCLLIGSKTDAFNRKFTFCRMHDMVRDMVIKIARDENFTSFDEKGRPIFNMQHCRVGISGNSAIESCGSKVVKNSITRSKLRTLFSLYIEKEVILNLKMKLFDLKWLRVLYLLLSKTMINEEILGKDCLDAIGSLRHLVYLHIGFCALEKLPDSLGDLSNLQLLELNQWPNLKMLPPSIIKLGKLISFQIRGCHSLECLPDGVQNLLNLERLEQFCPASSIRNNAFQIGQLKSLGELRRLHIVLKSPNQLEEGELKVLSQLQNLRVLLIEIDTNNDESSALMSKLNHQFSYLQDLEELWLIQFPGERTPIWLKPMTFPRLRFLGIFGGKLTHMGPGFWERENAVWKIEVLVLDHLSELVEDSSKFSKAMPYLRMLQVSHCSKLIQSVPSDVSRV
eukprot:TRINITY_DN2416_c0_g1_i1.p1 TRINITY_DN2416_c0_g1~~TRINITY_DN2416_c0_g1_i1.p1  ORF type:complete len:865 (+),score=120.96 TRINITY_DN2416_c0_g1_i1:1768-4362(+)